MMPVLRRILQCMTIFAGLLGCAVAKPPTGAWLDVPFVQQEKNACGAASVAMVMQYWGQQLGMPGDQAVEAANIERVLYSEKAGGIYASELASYFRQHGFETFTFRAGWSDLAQQLAKGRPLIIALGKSGGRGPLHYLVVTGINPAEKVVLVNDPAGRKLSKRNWKNFEPEWRKTNYWTLLAVPRP
jgi:ABC-type bacteriocin/lantibiotic exporter with double-glycine peptidase domain